MFKQLYRLIKEQLSLNKKVDKDLILKKLLQDNQLKNQQQPFLLQELEPRYMFDGAAIEAVDLADGVSEQEQIYILNALKQNENAQATESLLEAIEANSEGFTTDYSQFTEVMIIDSRVKDPHILIESVSRHASIEVITSEVDGVDAIAHILAKYQNLEAIHIVSHGAEAQLQLGNVDLTASNLMDYQAQLAQWGQALTEQGDILFYGCNVAEGDKGQAFIDALTALTSADIAASIDFTGQVNNVVDWDLEYEKGQIDITGLSSEHWSHLLLGDPPDAVSDAFTVISGVPVTITPLDNDSDPEMENLQIINLNDGTDHPISPGQTVTLASGTTVKLLADGQRLEVTATGTTENFSYTIEDSPGGGTDSATISLTIADDQASAEAIGFVMTVDTNVTYSGSSDSSTYILPVAGGAGQSYKVFWGDGTSNTYTSGGDITHNYAVSGQYTIAVVGDIDGFNFGNNDRLKVQTVEQWGNVVWSDLNSAFSDTDNVSFNASDTPILTDVTDLSSMFSLNDSANLNVSNWDVSNITNMSFMFNNTTAFNQSLTNWDVSSVTNMLAMFNGATAFNQALDNWDVSNVTNMASMFNGATAFNQALNSWDVSNVTTMGSMFQNATSFNQALDNWDVSNVTNMSLIFQFATVFDQSINNWNVSNVTNMTQMFYGASSFNQALNSWDVSSVTNMLAMFKDATAFNQALNSWDVSNVTNMAQMFYNTAVFDQELDNWDVSNVTNMSIMFRDASAFNQALNSWNVSNVTNMTQMFYSATSFNQSLDSWNTSNVTNMSFMFQFASAFDQELSGFDLSSVTNMSNFLSVSGMSVANYNATLIGWDSAPVPSGITIGVDNLYYGASAESARDNLINAKGWTFIGDSLSPAPVNTVPGAQNVDEDTLLAITGISATDPNGNLATTRLQVNNGVLNVTLSGLATISSGANGSNDLTISGDETDINNTLASLTYQGNLNFNGSDTLTVTSTDSGGTPLSDIDTVDITVNAVNDAPTAANNTVITAEDTDYTFVIGDFNYSDIDNDTIASIQVTSLETV
ncbi:BspA family leucine-rich repeat surface protein, partial [Cysteiniphilum halobium]|uniref:BspA family leucine-rich repeat surface protein n=1 Tax=Cysteiniphilum halobium TaxID=2219059 RepID=UPI000E651B77